MPRLTMLVLGFITAILCGSILAANTQPTIQSFNKMPLSFTKNVGQWDDRVLFRANAGGATMWFTKDGVTYQFTRRINHDANTLSGHSREGGNPGSVGRTGQAGMPILPGVGQNWSSPGFDAASLDSRLRGNDIEKDSVDQLVLTAKFVGANPNPEIIAEGQMEYKCNYFLGNEPSKWHTDVPNYEAITLKDIYPGIDLKYSGDGTGQAAYELVVAPGADIAQIKVAYEGAEETSIDADGKLILKTKWGDMIATIGSGVNSTCLASPRFALNSKHTLGLAADGQNPVQGKSGTLELSYSTYLGGNGDDFGIAIAVDGDGNAYVTGITASSDFPTLNPYQTDQSGEDVFVTKLSNSGNSLIYSTYLGGKHKDEGYGIAVDGSGNAYVTGYTTSSNFPTLNPYQAAYRGGSSDAFVTKLSSTGASLIYSTYLGGGSGDYGNSIAVDGDGNAYVTGITASSAFPTLNPFQTGQGGDDVFVTKFSSSGASLIYSTYLGGGSKDIGYCIAVDGGGNAYVTGYTESSNFPILNPYQTFQGISDAFVTKLSNSGNSLIYCTYIGGGSTDYGNSIAVDANGNAYVTGYTESSNFPTLNAYQATCQGCGYYYLSGDAFVTKLSSSGNSLIYSTYLGGGDLEDNGYGIAVDGSGNAYVTGLTNSFDFPTLNPYQTNQGGIDVFVTKLSGSGASLIYGTYLGGGSDDYGFGIAVDGSGNVYVTGMTFSSDFPTPNPYQTYYSGLDVFVTKLSWVPDYNCGDANTDEQIDLRDAVFLINYIFVGGPAPQLLSLADVNCSGSTNIADVVLLINYIFRAGPAPCAECK